MIMFILYVYNIFSHIDHEKSNKAYNNRYITVVIVLVIHRRHQQRLRKMLLLRCFSLKSISSSISHRLLTSNLVSHGANLKTVP